jgi:hypothetical protein
MSYGANDKVLLLPMAEADQYDHEEFTFMRSAKLNEIVRSTRYVKFCTFIVVVAALLGSTMYLSLSVRENHSSRLSNDEESDSDASRTANVGPDKIPLTRKCAALSKQCGGGKKWIGPRCCEAGSYCKNKNKDYSQCVESTVQPTAVPSSTPTMTPTSPPTIVPTTTPTETPTSPPTTVPTTTPTSPPTNVPSKCMDVPSECSPSRMIVCGEYIALQSKIQKSYELESAQSHSAAAASTPTYVD